MGQVRGTHSSPGVYIRYTGVSYGNIKKKNQNNLVTLFKVSEKEDVKPKPTLWVFGDKLPAIFS